MRTTLTIDDEVHAMLEERARAERRSLREVVNDALRRGLSSPRAVAPYRVNVHHALLVAGHDPDRLNQLADELEDEALVRRMSR